MAIRARDILRQIAMEHEIEIITGKVTSDYIHMFISVSSDAEHQQDIAVVERHKLSDTAVGVSALAQTVLRQTSVGQRLSGGQLGQYHRRNDPTIH